MSNLSAGASHYYMVYKPFNVLCQFSASGNKKTLKDIFEVAKDVYPVGRLDYDSEGLLLLTNDTWVNKALLHPSNAHERTYWSQVEGTITNEAVQTLQAGVQIIVEGKIYRTRKCIAALIDLPAIPLRDPPIRYRKNIPDSWLQLTLTEGKNRQVRKMTAAVGFPTLRLIRYSIGNLTIHGMKPGDIVPIGRQQLQLAFK